jgi:excisionase family DNA binding protein
MTKRDKLLRVDEVAERLNCSPRTVYRILSEGQLSALKVRGSLRIMETTLEHFIQQQVAAFELENGVPSDDRLS